MSTKSTDKKRAMIQALIKTLGVVSSACHDVGIDRKTHYNWYNNDKTYKDEVDDINGIALDFVESKLFQNIKDGKEASIFYYLNNRGKSRGYSRDNNQSEPEQKQSIIINFPKDFADLPDSEDKVNADR